MGNKQGKKKATEKQLSKQSVIVSSIKSNPDVGRTLRGMPLLRGATDEERNIIGGALEEKKFQSGSAVFSQGDAGDGFYLIKSGNVDVVFTDADGKANTIATLSGGDYFGESALMNSAPRGATVRTTSACYMLFLSKVKFEALFTTGRINVQFASRRVGVTAGGRNIRSGGPRVQIEEISKPANVVTAKTSRQRDLISAAVGNCLLFQDLHSAQKARVVNAFYQQAVASGTSVIKQGDPGINFYCVEEGNFAVFINKDGKTTKVADRGVGTSFGELALMYNAKRAATCTATEDSVIWILNRYEFVRIVQEIGETKMAQRINFMRDVKILAPLASYESNQLADALEEVAFASSEVIFKEGKEGDAMFFVVSGEVAIRKEGKEGKEGKELARVPVGGYFGERALMTNEPRAATASALSATRCLKLDRAAFNLLLGPLEQLLKRQVASYSSAKQAEDVEQLDRSIQFTDLQHVGVLGRGSFGYVTLVKHRQTGTAYALKAVSKAMIVDTGQQEHIMSEKKVMATVHHPFFINLITTFNSANELFFLLEPSMGGELFNFLQSRRFFAEKTAQFYAGTVILGFECLHGKGYCYRDLKPENLLIGADGYLKITDFGFAKKVNGRCWTLCGTPEYLAPEIVSNRGHSFGVDWWTVGVLIYEMLASYTPFVNDDFMKMYAKINRGKYKVPQHISKHARQIIKGFLQTNPAKRLGVVKGGVENIKNHKWFRGFDWDKLLAKQIHPPYVPTIKNPFDTSNFSRVEEEDDVPEFIVDPNDPWDADF